MIRMFLSHLSVIFYTVGLHENEVARESVAQPEVVSAHDDMAVSVNMIPVIVFKYLSLLHRNA